MKEDLGKAHTGDEWLQWSITVYFSHIIQLGMPTSKTSSFVTGIPIILGHVNQQGLLQAPTPDWGMHCHCQQRAMGITYQGMASNWPKLSLRNLLWHSQAWQHSRHFTAILQNVWPDLTWKPYYSREEEKRDLFFYKGIKQRSLSVSLLHWGMFSPVAWAYEKMLAIPFIFLTLFEHNNPSVI